jgi:hypothetical protein
MKLEAILSAAQRVLADRGLDGMPPHTKADAAMLAEFARDLLTAGPRAYENVTYDTYDDEPIQWLHEFEEEARCGANLRRSSKPPEVYALYRVGPDILRAAEAAESRAAQAQGEG